MGGRGGKACRKSFTRRQSKEEDKKMAKEHQEEHKGKQESTVEKMEQEEERKAKSWKCVEAEREVEEEAEEDVKVKSEAAVGEEEKRKDYILHLPNEASKKKILEIILKEVKDPKDLSRCYKTCRKFQEILEPNKFDFLFVEVLPFVMGHLSLREFLNCRAVSKTWRDSVGKVVESVLYEEEEGLDLVAEGNGNLEKIMLPYLEENPALCSDFCLDLMELEGLVTVDKLLLGIDGDNPAQNPFIGRRVKVGGEGFWGQEETRSYWTKIYRLLDTYGEFIWGCDILFGMQIMEGEETSLCEFCDVVHGCLIRLPNLRKLEVRCFEDYYTSDLYSQQVDHWFERMCCRDEFWPPLRHLNELVIGKVPAFLVQLIPIRIWQQLKLLAIENHEIPLEIIVPFDSYTCRSTDWFPKLKTLRVDKTDGYCRSDDDVVILKEMTFPVIENLIIDVAFPNIGMAALIEILNRFGRSLEQAHLFWRSTSEENCLGSSKSRRSLKNSCPEVRAPFLKTLKMQNVAHSLNFLQRLHSLEYLEVRCNEWPARNPFNSVQKGEKIEIHGFIKKMYESNLWRVLPSLKEFRYIGVQKGKILHYTRDGYEKFIENH